MMAATLRKTSAILTLIVFIGITLHAQAPEKMSYQAVIRNGAGELVVNQTVGMKISILLGSVAGTAVYVETHTPGANANGLVTLSVGTGLVVTGSFSSINWASGPYFIKTETDPAGGTNYTISGTNELLSVPYALYAKTATTAGTLAYGDFYALAPSDNAATLAPGSPVEFPSDGVTSQGILRNDPATFLLLEAGVYQVSFQVSVDEPGQLILSLDGSELPYTVVGRNTGATQIVGMALIESTFGYSTLQLRNPSGSSLALTITPYAGGGFFGYPVSAHLVITRLR
ncbi:hypothetical protein [Dyadobacter arcticus]|uniref:C1q domain-containing protein n=1 Tax=Dyadobacter arcticus TaxID=1078754 RepID=A0ABX0UNL9_9BACT|nr:hypothetical protein [Dyadobacter arcticus]NIJ54588.1 hypothetical protein [Dyadobacter arcticus]